MRLLFLCTHNACRSILCEVITRNHAVDRIEVASAGSQPSGRVHPLSLRFLASRAYPVADLRSKGIEDLTGFAPDAVITVCDDAANEACPAWLGAAAKAHWGLPDPSRHKGSDEEIDAAFRQVARTIAIRIDALLQEEFEGAQTAELTEQWSRIGALN
ncbi:MAG: arsenate reductase ArsC [Proteobacteria bacterium]|nr:arsenate reductase ArsC [Pseudomonadota bacterium]